MHSHRAGDIAPKGQKLVPCEGADISLLFLCIEHSYTGPYTDVQYIWGIKI